MIRWLRAEAEFWFGDAYRDNPDHVRSMRASWAKAAQELGLRHIIGTDTFADRIEGSIDRCQVEITYVTNFDVQKPSTIIRIRYGGGEPNLPILNAKSLLQLYEQNVGSRSALIAEEKAWLLGHRFGIGISGNEREMCYYQLWSMYEPADIVFVCTAMVKTMRNLDPNVTKVQG
jgi:hypothetical protein